MINNQIIEMESINFFEKLPEKSRELIKEEINIAENEEFVLWVTAVPKEVLKDYFGIPVELIHEIQESEIYQKFKSSDRNYRFGYNPDSNQ